ncbi:MAG: cupin domain-containing protein, partial [Ruminococcaceae bacterium]|nr:cupin domain-containing protein [Oscillospiraceae bacterium]
MVVLRYYYAEQVFSNDYQFLIRSVTSDASTYLHTHDYIEVEFIVSGTGKYMVDNNDFTLRRGDIYLIDEEHTHCILCDNVSKYFTLYFTKEFLSSIFPFEDRSIDAYTAFFKDM